jgi:hypothetical protein
MKVLIAPVGWYENRLFKSLWKNGPDVAYLITESRDGRIKKITEAIEKSLEKKLKEAKEVESVVVHTKSANGLDIADMARTFVEIIETERSNDGSCQIVLDVTSGTKEAALAAARVGSFYEVTVSYVPPATKLDSIEKTEDLASAMKKIKGETLDPGGALVEFSPKASSLPPEWISALGQIQRMNSPLRSEIIKSLIADMPENEKATRYRYWARVLAAMEKDRLIRAENGVHKDKIIIADDYMWLAQGLAKVMPQAQQTRFGSQ